MSISGHVFVFMPYCNLLLQQWEGLCLAYNTETFTVWRVEYLRQIEMELCQYCSDFIINLAHSYKHMYYYFSRHHIIYHKRVSVQLLPVPALKIIPNVYTKQKNTFNLNIQIRTRTNVPPVTLIFISSKSEIDA